MPYFLYRGYHIYYEECGAGEPLLLLHGNSVSSRLFESVRGLYENSYRIITLDFLGCGQSDRVEELPENMWYEQALQAIRLLELLGCQEVNIIGTSGGAITALNIALERPGLVRAVIADSLMGEGSREEFVRDLPSQREMGKRQREGQLFWEAQHGADWVRVVDWDTQAIVRQYQTKKGYFQKELLSLDVPVLLTGSGEDELIPGIREVLAALSEKIPNCPVLLFPHGSHPAMLSNAEEFAKEAKAFLRRPAHDECPIK